MVEIPGYDIDREIGRGGMANVYLAVQKSVDRQVALKVMSPVLLVDPTFSDRFMREARIAANLNHPGVVSVYDVGLHGNHHYIAMEYMDGGDLASRCSRGLEPAEGLDIVRQIALALDYAHSKGFVHRDVKPENILFRDNGIAVLTDFGIARAVDSSTQMTKTGAVIGTPQYMSPEQARGEVLDGRSDLYGLGIVLFEVLTGKVPYEGGDSVSVGIKHVTEPVPKLPQHLVRYQPVLNRLLAKRPEDRYQTGAEAAAAIEGLERAPEMDLDRTVAAPAPALDATRVSDPGPLNPARAPGPGSGPVSVSATPRPDGKLRQEPRLGSIDQIKSFDRTVSQPTLHRDGRGKGPLLVILLLALAAGIGWWQRERWLSLLGPDPGVIALLERGVDAESRGDVYGTGPEFANQIYQQVLEADPGNRAAEAGLTRVAEFLVERARQAVADGNPVQADGLLARARALAPAAVPDTLTAPPRAVPEPIPEAEPEPVVPAPEPVDTRAETLKELLADAMEAIRRGDRVGESEDTAAAKFRAMLALDPDNAAARAGLNRLAGAFRDEIDQALREERTTAAETAIDGLSQVLDDATEVAGYRQALSRLRQQIDERERAAEERRNQISGLLQLAEAALTADRLGTPPEDNAIERFRAVLAIDGENRQARDGLRRVASRYLQLAEQALEADRLNDAESMLERVEELAPEASGLDRARRRLALYREQRERNRLSPDQERQIGEWLAQAQAAFDRGELLSPPGQSAYDLFKSVLRLDPRHPEAGSGLRRVGSALTDRSRERLRAGDLDTAYGWFGDARETDPQNPMLGPLSQELAQALRQGVETALAEGDVDTAERRLRRASDLEPEHPDLARLQLQINIARE